MWTAGSRASSGTTGAFPVSPPRLSSAPSKGRPTLRTLLSAQPPQRVFQTKGPEAELVYGQFPFLYETLLAADPRWSVRCREAAWVVVYNRGIPLGKTHVSTVLQRRKLHEHGLTAPVSADRTQTTPQNVSTVVFLTHT